MATANIEVIHEVRADLNPGDWTLCLQWGVWHYDDGGEEFGYRFIYLDPDGNYRPQRGQARIPDAATMILLIQRATQAAWFVGCEHGTPSVNTPQR